MKKKIVGICGSIRKDSINKQLLITASQFLPEEYEMRLADISNLPLYNSDLEQDLPNVVTQLATLVKEADGIVISCPEYNSSITDVLKNALDWLSRPAVNTPLVNKPVAIMGATPGILGTIRAQMHLREILFALNMDLVRRPEMLIGQANGKFNEVGELVDDRALTILKDLMANLVVKMEIHHKTQKLEII